MQNNRTVPEYKVNQRETRKFKDHDALLIMLSTGKGKKKRIIKLTSLRKEMGNLINQIEIRLINKELFNRVLNHLNIMIETTTKQQKD